MFPLNIENVESLNIAVKSQTPEELWHLRFGHLNYKSLMLLTRKKIVKRVLALKEESQCEGCVWPSRQGVCFPVPCLEGQAHVINSCTWTYAGQ